MLSLLFVFRCELKGGPTRTIFSIQFMTYDRSRRSAEKEAKKWKLKKSENENCSLPDARFISGDHVFDLNESAGTAVLLQDFERFLNQIAQILTLLLRIVDPIAFVNCKQIQVQINEVLWIIGWKRFPKFPVNQNINDFIQFTGKCFCQLNHLHLVDIDKSPCKYGTSNKYPVTSSGSLNHFFGSKLKETGFLKNYIEISIFHEMFPFVSLRFMILKRLKTGNKDL